MTIQVTTKVHFAGDYFEVLDSRNVVLFDPTLLNIECYSVSTGNRKGYECQYAIENEELYLTSFDMRGSESNRDLVYLNFLLKESEDYEIKVTKKDVDDRRIFDLFIRSDHFYDREKDLKIQHAFLIAKDRRVQRKLTAARDDLPWLYKRVYLVKMKENRLFNVEDFSTEFYQFLRLFTIDGVLEERYRTNAVEFLTDNLGVKFDSFFSITK